MAHWELGVDCCEELNIPQHLKIYVKDESANGRGDGEWNYLQEHEMGLRDDRKFC